MLPTSPCLLESLRIPHQPMRIAVVTETYPPEVNGVATTIARFVEGLRERGHRLHLVRPRQGAGDRAGDVDGLAETLVRGVPIPRYPHLKLGLPATRLLHRLWREQRPDVVHLVTEGPLGWSALRAARRLGLPVSSDFRTNFHAYSRHYGLGWLQAPIVAYLRHFHNHTGLTMVPTEAMRRDLAGHGIRNLHVVARGVDTVLFDPRRRSDALRSQWGATRDTQVVLHVGRLAPEKNLAALTAAHRAMRAVRPDTRLVFVGDGPARLALQRQHPDAVFAGLRCGVDLATHYASADVFLFPSVTETFGNVAPEAMASGLTVLAYDYAAAAQLIRSGDNGLLAPFDDTDTFVRMASALAADRGREGLLGGNARATVLGLAWREVVGQLEAALRHTVHAAALESNTRQGLDTAGAAWVTSAQRAPIDSGSGGGTASGVNPDIDTIVPAAPMAAQAGS